MSAQNGHGIDMNHSNAISGTVLGFDFSSTQASQMAVDNQRKYLNSNANGLKNSLVTTRITGVNSRVSTPKMMSIRMPVH